MTDKDETAFSPNVFCISYDIDQNKTHAVALDRRSNTQRGALFSTEAEARKWLSAMVLDPSTNPDQ